MFRSRAAGLAGLAILAVAFSATAAPAPDVKAGDLTIQHPWTRATPGGAQVAGGYVTVLNTGPAADRLVGGSIEAATAFELHGMSTEGGVMTMRPTGPLEIPAGGRLTLDPSARHIMFTGLKHGLRMGETVPGTLVFEHAGTVPVQFQVEGLGARTPGAGDGSRPAHAMPGMDMN